MREIFFYPKKRMEVMMVDLNFYTKEAMQLYTEVTGTKLELDEQVIKDWTLSIFSIIVKHNLSIPVLSGFVLRAIKDGID